MTDDLRIGENSINFTYTGGGQKLCLKDAVIKADGRTVFTDNAEKSAGANPKSIVYTFNLASVPRKLTLTAKARTAGGTNSNGYIWFSEKIVNDVLTIADGTIEIKANAYINNKEITKVIIPSSVTKIGDAAFQNCSNLKEIDIPSSVKSIGSEAFLNCTSLTKITLHEGLTKLNLRAFKNTGIKEITIPSSVTGFGNYIFSECKNLTAIKVDKNSQAHKFFKDDSLLAFTDNPVVLGWEKDEFTTGWKDYVWEFDVRSFKKGKNTITFTYTSGAHKLCLKDAVIKADGKVVLTDSSQKEAGSLKSALYTFDLDTVPKKLTLTAKAHTSGGTDSNGTITVKQPSGNQDSILVIKDGTTKIGNDLYRDNEYITEIHIPPSVTTIGSSAFKGVEGLIKVVIPGTVKTIEGDAFATCFNLEEVIIEEGVEVIGNNAFYDCPKLVSVTIQKSIKSINNDGLFWNVKDKRIFHCYMGSDAYNLANKNGYKIDIIGIDEEHIGDIDLSYLAVSGNKTINAGLFKNMPFERIDLNNDITEIGKNAFNDKTLVRVKRNTGGDKCMKENGYYLCAVLADLNTYTTDKSKEIKEDFTRILCDDDPYWRWTSYKFNTKHPLKLEEVDDKLVITSFMYYPCKNVTVTDKNGKVLMRNKTIQPLMRTEVSDFDFLTDKVENYTLTSDDELYQIFTNMPVNWTISFNACVRKSETETKGMPIYKMLPVHCREWLSTISNYAYVVASKEYEELCYKGVEEKWFVTDNEMTQFLSKEQMDKLLTRARNFSLVLGRCDGGGLGGGNLVYLLDEWYYNLGKSGGAFYHEFSHCMDWGHQHGNMCNEERPAPWGSQSWPTMGSKAYSQLYKAGKLPYMDLNLLNSNFFSYNEKHLADPEFDVIKDDTLYIGNGMPSTGSFKNQTNFTKVVLPYTVVQINDSAFYGTMIKEITIPEDVGKINTLAFHNSTELESIIISDGVKEVGDAAFQNCTLLSTAKIGSGMRQLNYRLFKNSGLTSISIPGNIKYIGKEVFQDCKKLRSAEIADGVRKIGDNAFNNTALREIAIPASVTDIGKNITSKDVVWIVEKGSYAHEFAVKNNFKTNLDSSELEETAARILAESKNAELSLTDKWETETFTGNDVRRKWDFSSSLTGGDRCTVTFAYTGGAHMLCLTESLFVADDKPLAYFPERRTAGLNPGKIVYTLDIPAGTKKLELYALASTAGGTDSNGNISVVIPDDGTIEGITARILAEGRNAPSAPTGKWDKDTFTKSAVRRKWDFSSSLKGSDGGEYFVSFCYNDGGSSLTLSEALFVADGKPFAQFFGERTAGKDSPQIVYKLDIPAGTKKLELYALAKKTGDNTNGIISVDTPESKVAAVKKNAILAPTGKWEKGTFTGSNVRRKWDFSASLDGDGEYTVTFQSKGGDSLLLSDVVFVADGKLVSFLPEVRIAYGVGAMTRIVYFVNVPAGTKNLEMYGLARNNKDDAKAEGEITVAKQ